MKKFREGISVSITQEEKPPEPAALEDLLDFTAEDLLANENGQISPDQGEWLYQKQTRYFKWVMLGFGIIILGGLSFVVGFTWTSSLTCFSIVMIALGGGTLYFAYMWYLIFQDLNENRAEMLCGYITNRTPYCGRSGYRVVGYLLEIEDEQFQISEDLYHVPVIFCQSSFQNKATSRAFHETPLLLTNSIKCRGGS